MPQDLTFFVVAALAVTFAGISKGGFGSGAAFASAAILAVIIEPGLALGLILPLLMLIDVVTLRPYWKRWDGQDAKLLILGGVPGVVLGVVFYSMTNADVLRFLIGAISLAFVAWRVALGRGWVRVSKEPMNPRVGVFAGAVSGFSSFVSHGGGPPAAIYLLSRGHGKTTYQATTVIVFWVINIAKFIPYAFLGMISLETSMAGLVLAPFALLGAWIGVRAHRMVPEPLFFGVTYVLLSLTGSKLIWDALT